MITKPDPWENQSRAMYDTLIACQPILSPFIHESILIEAVESFWSYTAEEAFGVSEEALYDTRSFNIHRGGVLLQLANIATTRNELVNAYARTIIQWYVLAASILSREPIRSLDDLTESFLMSLSRALRIATDDPASRVWLIRVFQQRGGVVESEYLLSWLD